MRLIALVLIITFTFQPISYAQEELKFSIEQLYERLGYTDLLTALEEFDETFDHDINLPVRIPFPAETYLGRVSEQGLSIALIGEDDERVFRIHILNDPVEVPSRSEQRSLKDGTTVYLFDVEESADPHVSWLYMVKNDVTYSFVLNGYRPEIRHYKLMGVAESVE
ncbi:hypothetical protein J2R98_000197 [Alkalibacillus filiformis]|uniref:DUF4367 domain-containing protein n=1 Tax=Alkalibacillus filiformis TaxID=200990 RepID=A0ABU0DPY0_9BACI|nr:hypothetical protein [Alkalibacillus filiformis]MDQ0350394.1 hypothetical protein [Alkalibacillus filiformis]